MATATTSGRVILNGETFDETIAHLAAGRVTQDVVAEWLIGRPDIGIEHVAARCFGPGAVLRPTDLAFVDAGRRKAAEAKAAAEAAKAAKSKGKKPPSQSYAEFLRNAGDIEITLGDDTYTLRPRVFSTGTFGWFGQIKPVVVVGGEKLRTSTNVCLYVNHSGYRDDVELAKAHAKATKAAKEAEADDDE